MSPGFMAPPDNDSSLEISDFETQFVPQENDDETLYRVIEITEEDTRRKRYKVRWAGNDPKTKKPWDQSWVKKSDCTNDLVMEWKRKKARIRASAANTPISGRSKASGSRSKSIESPSANTKRSRLKQISAEKDAVWDEPPAGPSVIKKRKKAGSSRNSPSVSRPNKRRKTKGVEQTIVEENLSSDIEEDFKAPSIQASSRRSSQANSSQSEGEESTVQPNAKRNKGKGKALDDEDRRSKSSGSTRRGSSTTGGKGKKRASTEEAYNVDASHESDASNTSDHPHPRPRVTMKTKQRSKQTIISSQDNDPSPPSPSFGEPYLLQNVENDHADMSDEDRAHGTTTREVVVPTSHERRGEDRSEDKANVPNHLVKFPLRSERRRSKERSSVPTSAENTNQTFQRPPSPLLSPGSLARLREFDDFCQDLEEEEKRPDTETDQSPKKIPSEYLARRGTSEDDNEPVPSPSPSANDVNSPRSSPPVIANEPAPPPSSTRAKRPGDPDDSFEIVPETETQSSTNTQHRSPERATVASKMKPRTPSRGNSLQQPRRSASNERVEAGRSSRERSLKPVPVVSPSTFAPYLSSAHADSVSETDGDDDEVRDTIEQFSSPEKSGEPRRLASRSQKQKQAEKDRQDHDHLHEKGLAMYDKARRERIMVQNGGQAKKRSLSDLLKPPSPSESPSPEAIEETWDDHLIPEEPMNMDLDISLPNPRYPSSGTEKDSPVAVEKVNGSNGTEHPTVASEQRPPVSTVAESILQEVSEKRGEELRTALAEISRLEELISAERSQTAALLREREDDLAARSERIAALEKEMATERAANVARLAALEEVLAARAAPPEAPQTDATAIEELKAAVQKAAADKTSLEKDRDFFREEWSKASGHVTLVSAENAELKQRAQIAETRATDGLAMVRATFEARVKFLEGNAKEAQRLANFVMEKDQRTNDAIRSRAAQYPELKRQLDELKETSKIASEEQDLQIEELEHSLATSKKREEAWRAEVLRLSEDLNAHRAQRAREGRPMEFQPETHVYRCQFMDDGQQCPQYFETLRDLSDHLYYSTHVDGRV
ncbi:hypothetical protein PQX77_006753 [Marasmius sp. AFHP31]|nr:hypothetical protein PQX77_006753 [Marasmius sp. AFHP31]